LSPEGDVTFIVVACVVAAIGVAVVFLIAHARSTRERHEMAAFRITNVDAMTGIAFEQYLSWLLGCRGFVVAATPATGDLGVDLVATAHGTKIAIEAKRQQKPVSRRAVSEACCGKPVANARRPST
jgi:HJR/Mrr/RecB family endonuclease